MCRTCTKQYLRSPDSVGEEAIPAVPDSPRLTEWRKELPAPQEADALGSSADDLTTPSSVLVHHRRRQRRSFRSFLASFFNFGKLAPKRDSKGISISKSKERPTSKSRPESQWETPNFAYLVIPLAGILSAVTARFYDLGAPSSDDMTDSERAPLLSEQREQDANGGTTPVKKAGKWVARHAVALFASFLILAVVVILGVFFGGR